ncbi:Wnt [Trinorchestia longiramus]|nr:Wnt [Trinorchestia longiramus]
MKSLCLVQANEFSQTPPAVPQILRKNDIQSDGFSKANKKVDGIFNSKDNNLDSNIEGSSNKRKRQSPTTARLKSSPIDAYNKNRKNPYGTRHSNQPEYDKNYNFDKFSYNVRQEEQFYDSSLSRASKNSEDDVRDAVEHPYNDAAIAAQPDYFSNTSTLPIANTIVSSTTAAPVHLVASTTSKSNTTERFDEQNRGDQRKNERRRRKQPRRRGKKGQRSSNMRGKKAPTSLVPFPFPVVPRGTRESAFVHAISSAGVAHAITLRCSSGALEDCGCDHSVKGQTAEGFQWSGCSHNIAYGVSLSKRFVDASDKKKVQRAQQAMRRQPRSPGKLRRASRALINLHNNEAGRQLLQQDMRVGCKCHGVSGSCELKTCWRQMPAFREVGELLKEKFDSATEVKLKKVGGRLKLIPNKQLFKSLREDDLVFVASSPEYCDFDPSGGSLGTHGRACNKSSGGVDSCDRLCCDRGYTSSQQMVHERCNCKFHWCCYVECRTCLKEITVHTCN